MASKARRDPKRSQEDPLLQKNKEIEQLRQYVEESTFSGDEREMAGELSAADQHPGDMADLVFQRELMETTRGILNEEATLVQEALKRKAAGQYGICANCEKPISKARLAARPQATLCIDCQRELENGHARAS